MHYHHSHTESQIGGANGHLTAYGEYDIEFVSEITLVSYVGEGLWEVFWHSMSHSGVLIHTYIRSPLYGRMLYFLLFVALVIITDVS